MKYNKPKYKIILQSNENIWGNLASLKNKLKRKKWKYCINQLDKKNKKGITGFSEKRIRSLKLLYKERLVNLQKFKHFYGNLPYSLLKREFNMIKKKNQSNLIDNFIFLLESRLDVLLYRSGFFSSIFESKQAILHSKVQINGTIVTYPNCILKEGDCVDFNTEIKPHFLVSLPYIQVNKKLSNIIYLRKPRISDIKYPFSLNKKFLFEYFNKR